jgi:hypothetical protein
MACDNVHVTTNKSMDEARMPECQCQGSVRKLALKKRERGSAEFLAAVLPSPSTDRNPGTG